MDYFLAIDIGASSGRHILAHMGSGGLEYEEIYRFKNFVANRNGSLCWDLEYLLTEVKNGLKKCAETGRIPLSAAIDTWGVDFVLLDKNGGILGDTVSYRDKRTQGVPDEFFSFIPEAELYSRTGIQKQQFNTVFQLFALKKECPECVNAESFLMIPDYLNFRLTGVKANEYTNATTTGLVNAVTGRWDSELIKTLGFKAELFGNLRLPGEKLGRLNGETADFDTDIIIAPSHDTASAVLAVPYAESAIYISSGTWSLIGVELDSPILSEESRSCNFTNEGGYGGKVRYLKNIMGLWMLQSVKAELLKNGNDLSFEDLSLVARQNEGFPSYVDVADSCFLASSSMTGEIQEYCNRLGLKVPQTTGEICAVIYGSLARGYAEAAAEIERLTGRSYDIINIVGGGSRDGYLCELTERVSGKKVIAGPAEATALGNIVSQMIAAGKLKSVTDARNLLKNMR